MDDGSKGQPRTTVGLDLGDRYSYLCFLDTESGEVIEEGRLRTTPEAFGRRFASEQPLRIAIEAGTHSPWVSRLLEGCGHEVLVANARKTRLIYANRGKTDEVDAENLARLARLARLDPKLLSTHSSTGSRSGKLKGGGDDPDTAVLARDARLLCPIASDLMQGDCASELGPSESSRDRSEDRSAFDSRKRRISSYAPSHQRERAHRECGWKYGEGQKAVALEHDEAATSTLTKCAFSWKYVATSSAAWSGKGTQLCSFLVPMGNIAMSLATPATRLRYKLWRLATDELPENFSPKLLQCAPPASCLSQGS